jgi:hypothetical protein
VTTVEHDKSWYEELSKRLPVNATLRLVEPAVRGTMKSAATDGFFDEYVAQVADLPDDSLDLAIIDGRARVECGIRAAAKVRPDGMLLLDDSNRPRYAPLREALQAWPSVDLRGLKIGSATVFQSTVWTKPAAT